MQDLNDKLTGGTLSAAEWNEVPTEIQNTIIAVGQSLTTSDLQQLNKAIASYAGAGDFYSDSGAANVASLAIPDCRVGPRHKIVRD